LRIELKENLLRILHPDFGKLITVDGAVYSAEEIVIHTPSEHTLEGKIYDMEISIIHYGVSQGDIAKQATLNFLFEKTPGSQNKFLEDIDFFNLPSPIDKERDIVNLIDINRINVDPENIGEITQLKPFTFFTYQGSLSFPPCTENTIVYVASQPLKIGSTALQLFEESLRVPDIQDQNGNIIYSNMRPENARRTQELNGRPIFHHSPTDCTPPLKPKKSKPGHYEKVRKAFTSYFYVNGNKPSGLPNAYVVSEEEARNKNFKPAVKKE
jgi:carbonic anhydrase